MEVRKEHQMLAWVVPAAGFVLVWMVLIRPMAGGAGGLMAVGPSKAHIHVENDVKVTFASVDEANERPIGGAASRR